jgi:hypothetical protein
MHASILHLLAPSPSLDTASDVHVDPLPQPQARRRPSHHHGYSSLNLSLCPLPATRSIGPFEQVLEHPEGPDFTDAAASGFTYDTLTGVGYLQYPHKEAFGSPSFTVFNLFCVQITHLLIVVIHTH